jgi:hypothetical protein
MSVTILMFNQSPKQHMIGNYPPLMNTNYRFSLLSPFFHLKGVLNPVFSQPMYLKQIFSLDFIVHFLETSNLSHSIFLYNILLWYNDKEVV